MPVRSNASSTSMHTTTSLSSSWLGSSPSRQSPTRNGVRSPRGSLIRESYESPTRQIHIEFNKLLVDSDREFHKRLDQDAEERAKRHRDQLNKAAQEHQRIQEGAKLEIERIALEEEQKKRQREEAQQREIERLNLEKVQQEAEAQRQKLEALRRKEEAEKAIAERNKQLLEADARAKARREQEEAVRKQKEEQERRAREAAAAAAHKTQTQVTRPSPLAHVTSASAETASAVTAKPTSTEPSSDILDVHKKYLALHGQMKKFRKEFADAHKEKGNPLKESIGNARRNMKKRLGQVTVERKDSQAAIQALRAECFGKALETPGPMIDIRPYIISQQIPPLANEAEAQYPAFLLFIWIYFEKFLITQWFNEAANEDGRIIAELGLIAASLYADPRYMWKGIVPLTDTFTAKLHRVCPMLFGIRGNADTNRAGLGLDKFHAGQDENNRYAQLLTGVGAGYAALSLRNFNKVPAVPMSDYWRAIVTICNTPSEALYPGHFFVLKGLLQDFVRKFLTFYGVHAKAVIKRAVFDLPNRAPKGRPGITEAANLVKVLPDTWKVQLKLTLD